MNKQIEEMSKIILDEPHLDEIQGFEKRIAERLYNAGYRKQIEGEWLFEEKGLVIIPLAYSFCSLCNGYGHVTNYCPHCGARMKAVQK